VTSDQPATLAPAGELADLEGTGVRTSAGQAPPPGFVETLRQEIRATDRKAGLLLLLVAVGLMLFLLHETHEELREAAMVPTDLWVILSAVVLGMATATGAGMVFLVPGVRGLGAVLPDGGNVPAEDAVQQEVAVLRRVAQQKALFLAGAILCLLAALALGASVYVKAFLLPHGVIERGGRPA
jgi:hypothetical protein